MKDRTQFELEIPQTLKEVILDEVYATTGEDFRRGKEVQPITDVEALMQKVYAHIERQALEVYHSNEPWALRQWALSNILKEEVVNEASVEIASELISPVVEWQEQSFDPITHLKSEVQRLTMSTQKGYLLTASRFVALIGRKKYYTYEDVKQYLNYMAGRYKDKNTYYQECVRLLQFLKRLPDADKGKQVIRLLDIDMPKYPKKRTYIPSFTYEDIEALIWSTVIDNIPYQMVLRLLGATIYGRRVGELTEFKVNLDGTNPTVEFATEKGGEEVPHPIPQSLIPLFSAPVEPMSRFTLQRRLKKICKRAGINLPYRAGYHSFRRRIATIVKHQLKSDIDTHKFMRWAEPRQFSILALYDQTRYEEVDWQALEAHPIVKIWEEVCPYLLKFNTTYETLYHNAH